MQMILDNKICKNVQFVIQFLSFFRFGGLNRGLKGNICHILMFYVTRKRSKTANFVFSLIAAKESLHFDVFFLQKSFKNLKVSICFTIFKVI